MNRKHGLKVFILALLLSAVLLVPGLAVASQGAAEEAVQIDTVGARVQRGRLVHIAPGSGEGLRQRGAK